MVKNFEIILRIFLFLFFSFCYGQKDTNWYAFYNSDSTKIGYKDADGNIKIEPKFDAFLIEQVFKNVVIVSEKISDHKWEQYYLNKSGKKFGIDSIYVFDFEFAKESNGKIKFRDYKTDKVGFFDTNGKIVIPAIYDDAKDFHKGLAIVIKGAQKKRWEPEGEKHDDGCDHWSWDGGKVLAIDNLNRELFEVPENKDYSYSIDFSNFEINANVDSEVYTTYKGSDGNRYSFYSPEKDFNKWFDNVFLPDFRKNNTVSSKYFYELISVDDNDNPKENTAWKNHDKFEYLKKKQYFIDEIFKNVNIGKFQKSVSWETLSNYSYFPENKLPKEDLTKNTVIAFYCGAENDYSSTNSFQFTKIGNSFFISSAPSFKNR